MKVGYLSTPTHVLPLNLLFLSFFPQCLPFQAAVLTCTRGNLVPWFIFFKDYEVYRLSFWFTPWGALQEGWGGGSLNFPSRFVWGSCRVRSPPPAQLHLELRERGLPEVQTPTPLQGLHTFSVKGHPWKWLPQWTWGFLGGGQSRHPRTVLGCWASDARGHLVGQWAVVSFPGPLQQFLLISSINLSHTSFHEFNGGAPRSGGLDWKSLGHRRDPGGSGPGCPGILSLVVG